MRRSARMSELRVSRNLQRQQTAEHRRVASESRRGERRESRLYATQVSATHRGLFCVFFRLALESLLHLLASLLSLSSFQTFPLYLSGVEVKYVFPSLAVLLCGH